MDPLSDVLSLLKPRSYVSSGFDAGGDWSIQFSNQQNRMKCYAVISGECWLLVDDSAEPVKLRAGDCFVLPSGRDFRLASDMALAPVDSSAFFPPPHPGGVVTVNSGGDFYLVGSRFGVSGRNSISLLHLLPPIVHIQTASEQSALIWSVERMRQELREQRPGNSLIAQHLAHMMLVQALRLHLEEGPNNGVGWFYALADKQLSAAISAIHADPAHRWTLQTLAERAGMSRSNFALKFKATVGETAMDYVSRWRMMLAGDRFENTNESVSAVALSLGYESESAFSTAFKRILGCTPRQYKRGSPSANGQNDVQKATPLHVLEAESVLATKTTPHPCPENGSGPHLSSFAPRRAGGIEGDFKITDRPVPDQRL